METQQHSAVRYLPNKGVGYHNRKGITEATRTCKQSGMGEVTAPFEGAILHQENDLNFSHWHHKAFFLILRQIKGFELYGSDNKKNKLTISYC